MRIKLTLIRGIAALALSASVFLGCQDFLSEDKAAPMAETPSQENLQVASQEASSQDNAVAEPAKDLPANTADTAKPAAPATSDNAAECKEIYAAMQAAKEPLYGELKNQFGALNCDLSKAAGPYVPPAPPDSATLCKNLRATLAMLDPSSPKYPMYQQDIATYCTDAQAPAAPIAPSPVTTTPAAPDNAAECKEIYAQMQTAKEPLYGELKFKFTSLNCDSKAAGPYVPPDSATLCKNLRATLAMLDPSSPKYLSYQQEIATYCADAQTPAAPIATPAAPAASDNTAECKEIYAAMQAAKEPLYGELKNKFGALNCDLSKAAGPYVPPAPPDSATLCKNLRATLAMLDPSSPKYLSYQQEIATYCAAKP